MIQGLEEVREHEDRIVPYFAQFVGSKDFELVLLLMINYNKK